MTRKQILCNLKDEKTVILENMLEATDTACNFFFSNFVEVNPPTFLRS